MKAGLTFISLLYGDIYILFVQEEVPYMEDSLAHQPIIHTVAVFCLCSFLYITYSSHILSVFLSIITSGPQIANIVACILP
jgi:hypothetical protein